MTKSISITRRLTCTVLILELLSAIVLIGAITIHERHVQLKAFDSSLEVSAESLMGAVQDAEDKGDNVMLNMREVHLDRKSVFLVEDERGRVLGSAGELPQLELSSSWKHAFHDVTIKGRSYRFLVRHGLRVVDPDEPNGGTPHNITIAYGTPVGHVWHEVLESIRFFAIATAILLSVTALTMAWSVREVLFPVTELAREAERINSHDWHFEAPTSAKETVELRPLVAALEAALARLQRSFEQQKRFTNDAAHELKTDAAIVKSSLQLLSMRKRTVEEYSQGLALSLEDFTRLEMTVQKMLTLARLEQPREIKRSGTLLEYCSLRGAIEDAVHQSKPLAELKAIEVIVECAVDTKVPIDSRDALLLCSNILLNALQHSPHGSVVRIAMTTNDGAMLTVEDQGEGVSDEDRAHVFEPFYRGDPSRSRKSGGTGLGLSICKAICERARGSIQIENRTEGGALVTVKLPAEPLAPVFMPSALLKV
ncbi:MULTISPECIES: cell wall metabolism sensor histidine kinase WalK [Acidobacteriaceae]|uniref:sensor histidine kinase n=1 Tax=Acidobacteriaceae TaxID=204434 RepID=UPI00131C8761|nr:MULTISPECIES: HAMP domain-containing sensor histidine kinase [Acidobacteriaceae]MDW5265983.1 HAMP domain-containing sensor histidine kinase [Edaphobacter sp.]